MVKPTLLERVGRNLIIKRYTTWSYTGDGLVRMSPTEQGCQKSDQAVLLVGLPLLPNRALYFGLRPGSFRKWYLLNQPTFFAKKWSPMSLIVSNFRSSDEQGWRNGQKTSGPVFHSRPLQQNWIQIFSRKTQGKILFIFIFGLVSQNIPMSNWAHFTVSLIPTRHYYFWRWTGDGFYLLTGVVVLRLSSAKVWGTMLPLEVTGLGPGMLVWWGKSGWALVQDLSCSKGSKCMLQWRKPW